MANYSDLNTLFQNGMGSFAAGQAGMQSAYDQQLRDLETQKVQQEINQNAQMNPLNLMFRQAQIQNEQANAANTQAIGQTNQVNANVAQSTQAQQIAAKLSSLTTSMSEDQVKQMGADAQKAINAASILQNVPVPAQPAAFGQILDKYGISRDNPMVAPILQGDPNNIVPALHNIGQGMAMASSDYITKMAMQKQSDEAAMQRTQAQNAAHLAATKYSADTSAKAQKYAADARLQIAQATLLARKQMNDSKIPLQTRIGMLQAIPEDQKTDEDRNNIVKMQQLLIQNSAAKQGALPSQVMGMDNPIVAATKAVGQAAGQQAAPNTTTPATAKPTGNMRQIGTSGGRPVFEDANGNRFIQ